MTVRDISHALRRAVGQEFPETVLVRGEVSNWNVSRGHAYFSLKDGDCCVSAVMWSTDREQVPFPVSNGMQVELSGQVSLYARFCKVQFVARGMSMVTDEKGERQRLLDRWRDTCELEGLVRDAAARSVSATFRRISIVTSAGGAAKQDCLSVIRRRCPDAEVWVHDCVVQGPESPASVAAALDRAEACASDIVVVCRGGGSKDDLFYWNDPIICRRLRAMRKPVVSGIGHDTDSSLADRSVDVAYPTPSVAAERVTLDRRSMLQDLRATLEQHRPAHRATGIGHRLRMAQSRVRRHLGLQRHALDAARNRRTQGITNRLRGAHARLRLLDPHAVLRRGFCVVRSRGGAVCRTAAQVRRLKYLVLETADGAVELEATRPEARATTRA